MSRPLSNSSFNKWRCLIALAHIDNKFQPSEKDFFLSKLRSLPDEIVTNEQMSVFQDDFRNKKRPEEFFRLIEDRLEKIDLLCLAYELFWADGEFDDRERKAYRAIRNHLEKTLHIERFVLDDLAKMKAKKITIEDIITKIVEGGGP